MAMPISATIPPRSLWTVADLEQLPADGNRYEILHGELLVTPMPSVSHQDVAMSLSVRLYNWCRVHTGWRCAAPGGLFISETSWVEPDIAVYPISRRAHISDWRDLPAPALVVEILSPSTTKVDRHRKRPAYLARGVGEVWLVDIETRTIERWTAASDFPEVHRESSVWEPVEGLPPLVIDHDELFGPAVSRPDAS